MRQTATIAKYALMTALVAVGTFVVRIPTVATDGYINLGDALVLFCGVVFGPPGGILAGGLGSALADLISGYAHWALPTFLIKGLEGGIAGMLFPVLKKTKWNRFAHSAIACVVAAVEMITGYFFASWVMKGNAVVAFTGVPENAIQGGVGAVLANLLLFATSRNGAFASVIGKNQFYEEPRHIPPQSNDTQK